MKSLTVDSTLQLRRTPQSCRAATLWLLWSEEPPEVRRSLVRAALNSTRQEDTALAALLEGRRQASLVGASWAQVMPGRIANVWPPRLVAGEPTGTAERLLSWSDTLLRRAGVRLAQVLLRSSRGGDASLLVRHGYRFTAELLYLVCEVTAAADVASDHELVFTACGEQDRQRLLRVITATYDGTQDIPALNGLRSPEDVLDGYAHPGADATPHWFLVTHHSDDAGCLLLCDYPAAAQLELVYMGLVPAARGRGWGADIVRFTQYSALATQRTRVVLAVDAANDPALVTYGRAGFFEWDRRSLFLKVLS